MGLKKLTEKLAAYFERLETGQTHEIKPDHVRKVLDKLHAKEAELRDRLARAETDGKRAHLQQKLQVTQEHISRAEYLLTAIERARQEPK